MLRYFIIAALTFSLLGCETDRSPEQAPPQEPMDQQMPQPDQPAVDADISSEELQQFVEAANKAQEVQMEAQQEMIAIVDEEGISVETYNRIAEAIHMGQSPDEIEATTEEMDQYDRASELISEIEQTLEPKITDAVNEAGMAMERFQEINMAIQQNPQLQQRVEQKMQEYQMTQPQDPQQPQDQGY